MKLHRYDGPVGHWSSESELEDYEIPTLIRGGFGEAWYWYHDGGYDGYGYAILTKPDDKGLYVHCMGHCSCYGPMDEIGDADRWDSLADLKAGATTELLEELAPLIKLMEGV